jgi:hypothetical protein
MEGWRDGEKKRGSKVKEVVVRGFGLGSLDSGPMR